SHTTTHEACHIAHHTGHPHNDTGANRNNAEQRGHPGNNAQRTRPHRHISVATPTQRHAPATNDAQHTHPHRHVRAETPT
ncbi:hypothetical protein DXG01_012813, partial [Tephrocybe rancida]